MPHRRIQADGAWWEVVPSGRVTVYDRDEFGIVFRKGSGPGAERRYTRYTPLGSRRRDMSLAELSDARLLELLRQSQPEWTSPDGRLARRTRGA